jgi:hypothetical protein
VLKTAAELVAALSCKMEWRGKLGATGRIRRPHLLARTASNFRCYWPDDRPAFAYGSVHRPGGGCHDHELESETW